MRELTSHRVNECNQGISIMVEDAPGAGGANHCYVIRFEDDTFDTDLHFQEGPIGTDGPNGITQEMLIAICIDRLQGFQSGKFACRENALALTKLEEAQMWLQKRTRDRQARGVEGTHTP